MRTQTQSILVVEDNSGVALMLQMILEGEGYQVLSATNVKGAIETLSSRPVQLILTDAFSLTPQTALESLEPLLEAAGTTPVALMTGHRVSMEEARARGFCAVIGKPFDFDTLLREIRGCMAGSGVAS